jgi:hypothetical protein
MAPIPHVLFLYYLRGMRGRPSWPAEPRTTQDAPAPTGSLPGGRSLVFRRILRRPVWPITRTGLIGAWGEVLQGAPPRAVACWLRKVPTDCLRSGSTIPQGLTSHQVPACCVTVNLPGCSVAPTMSTWAGCWRRANREGGKSSEWWWVKKYWYLLGMKVDQIG